MAVRRVAIINTKTKRRTAMSLCACGCGNKRNDYRSRGKYNHGHSGNGQLNGRSKLTDKQARAICLLYKYCKITQNELSSRFGVTQQTISRIINGTAYLSSSFKTLTKKQRTARRSKRISKLWKDNYKYREKCSKPLSRRSIYVNSSRFTSKLELRAGAILSRYGIVAKVRVKGLCHIFDYGDKEKKVLVEINGCYWHSHGCAWDRSKNTLNRVRDKRISDFAKENDYKLLILWECQEIDWKNKVKEFMSWL